MRTLCVKHFSVNTTARAEIQTRDKPQASTWAVYGVMLPLVHMFPSSESPKSFKARAFFFDVIWRVLFSIVRHRLLLPLIWEECDSRFWIELRKRRALLCDLSLSPGSRFSGVKEPVRQFDFRPSHYFPLGPSNHWIFVV